MFDAPAFEGFVGQRGRDQALTVAGGGLACLAGYLAAATLLAGDVSAVAADGGWARRFAAAGAGVACWSYYVAAFVRGRGGPVLDAVLYPLVTVGVVPTLWRLLAAGDAGGLLGGWLSLSLAPLVLAAFAVVPGVGAFLTLLALWAARLDEAARREWEQRHLTPSFRAAFLEED